MLAGDGVYHELIHLLLSNRSKTAFDHSLKVNGKSVSYCNLG